MVREKSMRIRRNMGPPRAKRRSAAGVRRSFSGGGPTTDCNDGRMRGHVHSPTRLFFGCLGTGGYRGLTERFNRNKRLMPARYLPVRKQLEAVKVQPFVDKTCRRARQLAANLAGFNVD